MRIPGQVLLSSQAKADPTDAGVELLQCPGKGGSEDASPNGAFRLDLIISACLITQSST